MKKSELRQLIREEIQNVSSNYPKYDRNEFRKHKNELKEKQKKAKETITRLR